MIVPEFNDPENGTQVIRFLAASAENHGTDVGWDPSLAQPGTFIELSEFDA